MSDKQDPRLIEAIDHYAEDAAWDARAFARTEPGASLLADAEVGRAMRGARPYLAHICPGCAIYTGQPCDCGLSAIAAALGDDDE